MIYCRARQTDAFQGTGRQSAVVQQILDNSTRRSREAVRGAGGKVQWYCRYLAIPLGAVLVLLVAWPLIMWTELIVIRDHIKSETDMVSVWLFFAQVLSMMIPPFSFHLC
jgi:hypothetical protein